MAKERRKLTDLQSQAIQCLEAARRGGGTLSAEARRRGLNLRQVYDALVPLRRRGLVKALPGSRGQTKRMTSLRFARVRIAESAALSATAAPLRLRLSLPGGRCAEMDLRDAEQLAGILRALERAA
jgi:hypothetical protein